MARAATGSVIAQALADGTRAYQLRSEQTVGATNPARGRRMRLNVPKPARSFLEMDELVAITDAAAEQDVRTAAPPTRRGESADSTAARVAALWRRGVRPSNIAAELGKSKATVSYHLQRLGAGGPPT